jgi:6-pyruvoyltetrahydropterin/6-carboxytetrahydropterin synthase
MAGVFEIHVKTDFSAAHCLREYEGDCERLHGHNWTVEVFVQCRKLNAIGLGIDFREVKQVLREVVRQLDHSHLNDLSIFRDENPTSENIARFIFGELVKKLNSEAVSVSKVKIAETAGAGVYYWEE